MPENAFNKFAPVAPIQILEELLDAGPRHLFGDYHLLLAHHTLEHPERFHSLFTTASQRLPFHPLTIIMDNSIVELGGSVPTPTIVEAVNTIKSRRDPYVSVIPVLPDVMGKGADTLLAVKEAYPEWDEAFPKHIHPDFMLVLQGEDFHEYTWLVNEVFLRHPDRYPRITWVGIPRHHVALSESRWEFVSYMRMVAPHINIHLLGFSDDILDDISNASRRNICGIDSAVPLRHSSLLEPTSKTEVRSPAWFEEGQLTTNARINLERVRRWLQPQ